MAGRCSAIIALEIDREIAENAHGQLTDFPADFPWYIENQQTVDACLIVCRCVANEMVEECVTCAGVIVESRRQLDVKALREIKSRAYLPRQQERIGSRDAAWLRPDWIFRIGIIVNELCEICEDIDLDFKWLRRGRRGYNAFALLAVGLRHFGSAAAADRKGVFPLLGQAFRIDIVIPRHERGHERIRHSACGQSDVGEALVNQISLPATDTIARLRERTVDLAVIAERHVGRARTGAGFQSKSEKPIVSQRTTQANAHSVAFTRAFIPIIWVRGITPCCPSAAIFVTHAGITVELELIDRRGQFPLS